MGDASYAPHFAADELRRDHGLATFVLDADIDDVEVDPHRRCARSYAGEVVDQVGPPEFGPERDRWYEDYFEWEYSLVPASRGDRDFDFEATKP